MISRVWTIATNTFRENRRDRVLYLLLFFAGVLILMGIAVGELSPFEQSKVLLDLGQSAMFLMGSLIALLLGTSLVSREIERRTAYVILSKPIGRGEFLVGKVAGLSLTLTAMHALMTVMLVVVALAYGATPTLALAQSILLLWAQLLVLVSIAVTFASFVSSTPLAATFSLSTWIIGQVTSDLHGLAQKSDSGLGKAVLTFLYWVLPNLSLFDIKTRGTHGIALAASDLLAVLLYGALYSAALLALATLVFSRRDFR